MCLIIGSSQSGRAAMGMNAVDSISSGISTPWIRPAV